MRTTTVRLALATIVAGALAASPVAEAPDATSNVIDEEASCPGLVTPVDVVDVNPLDDEDASIHVLVLNQGSTPLGRVRQLLGPARDFYASMGMQLRLSFRGLGGGGQGDVDADALIEKARRAVGGRTPPGVDAVLAVTTRNLTSGALGGSVAGKVMCVGGYAHPTLSFGAAELKTNDPDPEDNPLGVINPYQTSIIFAHELLHLFGAHHHFANCAEGDVLALQSVLGQCSIMVNAADLASFSASTANHRIARGFEQRYRDDH